MFRKTTQQSASRAEGTKAIASAYRSHQVFRQIFPRNHHLTVDLPRCPPENMDSEAISTMLGLVDRP